ncbi:MAG: hypothetical protein ACF8PN_04985 [Phycisphaerales bacterium]
MAAAITGGAVTRTDDPELAELVRVNVLGDLVAVAEALDDALTEARGALERLDRIIEGAGVRRSG